MAQESVDLPKGVSEADWLFEKRSWQNPRIRHLLGCVRLLEDVMESNYALLHCSPKRLDEIWDQLRAVSHTLREKVTPLLVSQSRVPELEEIRSATASSLKELEDAVLAEVDRFPDKIPEEQHDELRRFLCGALGRVQAFLLDALGQFLARDPRSQHDADYFLAKRFVRDVDEAEWLETSVSRLEQYLRQLNRDRLRAFTEASDQIKARGRVPTPGRWQEIRAFLDELVSGLTEELRSVVGLRGIRVDELELLEQYSSEIPAMCGVLDELYQAAREATGRLESKDVSEGEASGREAGLEVVHSVFSGRMVRVMADLDGHLRDLLAFVTLWLRGIRRRRALMLRRREGG